MQIAVNTPLDQIDPGDAWAKWEPSSSQPWDRRRVCLLWRRGGLGANPKQIEQSLQLEPAVVVDSLVESSQNTSEIERFNQESSALASAVRASGDMNKLTAWWLHRLLNSPQPLVEKLTVFWHGHFATGAEKVLDSELMFQQNELLRKYALGDFRQLVQQISKDPAMLIYLDSVTNRKAHANENYARELMELFCLGEGNYSESDVQQLAKCFTGWEIRRKQFRFNAYQHDESQKRLLGEQGVVSGEQAVDVVLQQASMPKFIVGKLFQYFLLDEPTPPAALLAPLEELFVASQYAIAPVVKTMLASNLMLSGWSIGRRIRSPIELVIEFLRTLQGSTNLTTLVGRLKKIGQALFYPPNVKGWPGGRSWINSSTLIGRANLIYDLLNDSNTTFAGGTLADQFKKMEVNNLETVLDWIDTTLLALPLASSEREQLQDSLRAVEPAALMKRALIEVATLPRIHLS
jgi:uncharacterized protein (DUF1800 family)